MYPCPALQHRLHPGILSGPFVILRFPTDGDGKPTEPPTVYIDGFTGALYLDKEHEVQRYDQAFRGMGTTALDQSASKRLIEAAIKELAK